MAVSPAILDKIKKRAKEAGNVIQEIFAPYLKVNAAETPAGAQKKLANSELTLNKTPIIPAKIYADMYNK